MSTLVEVRRRPKPRESRRVLATEWRGPTKWRRLALNTATRARTWIDADGQWRIDELAYPRGSQPPRRFLVFRRRIVKWTPIWEPLNIPARRQPRTLAAAQRACRDE